ncbi:amidohydrolase family protein [uncultured Amnibacterium sp.]|uniref:amidohydrolase family protein n=1 Tax=uncultured Amnibacterium sp. TaxID=1631851 RepID=UPI0035CA181C
MAAEQAPSSNDVRTWERIDFHAHLLPDFYQRALTETGEAGPDGMSAAPGWNVQDALSMMDRTGIRFAVLSLSSPGVHFGDDAAARRLARRINEFGAALVTEQPDRFAMLATLPLPDVDGAVAELEYALDVLHLDGVAIETNARGLYPGDDAMRPVFEALEARSALLFLHPTSPPNHGSVSFGRPRPILEFPLETTRAVIDLVLAGTLRRSPRVRVLVPHGGGALAVLADRVATLAPAQMDLGDVDVIAELGALYYDVAGMPVPRQLPALLQLASKDRLLYGSDWPFTPIPIIEAMAAAIGSTDLLTDADREHIGWRNAVTLLPRLAALAH